MAHRASIEIPCREPHCDNVLVLRGDDFHPKDWLCPRCEAALYDQQMSELERERRPHIDATAEDF